MAQTSPALSTRLVCGAIAGFVATAPMTAVMHRVHRRLDGEDRYPLPPREIVGSVAPPLRKEAATSTTLAAHFAYGALSGAALAAVMRKPTLGGGVAGGLSIWLASYLGWIPAFGILKPAIDHPAPRNALMNLAHIVWGAAYAIAQRDLLNSGSAFGDGLLKDVPGSPPTRRLGPDGNESVLLSRVRHSRESGNPARQQNEGRVSADGLSAGIQTRRAPCTLGVTSNLVARIPRFRGNDEGREPCLQWVERCHWQPGHSQLAVEAPLS